MAKIYVAGNDLKRARNVMDNLIKYGHLITYDWVATFDEGPTKKKAIDEANAVRQSDILVYLWAIDQESARYEAGMAMGLEKIIIVSGRTDAFFFQLPNIYCVHFDDEIVSIIKDLF